MYSGWISERRSVEDECGCASVLNSYPPNVGKDVTSSIIRSLVLLPNEKKGFFKSTKDLEWTMDVICYGLTMPLTEVEMIKNCVFLYLEWTTVMLVKPKSGIPVQIIENKDQYFSTMLRHMANLFIPRESSAISIQVTLCIKVLHHIREIVEEGNLKKNTLENVLRFYLGISGHLLSVPPVQSGLAEQLCGKLINCLLTVWLHACCNHFPSPSLWCTLAEMVLTWRHHHMLILQWNKLMFSLTCKVLLILYGPDYPLPSSYNDEDAKSEPVFLPLSMSNEIVVQCWHRFMHIIGNPVALCKYEEISDTEYFRQYYSQFDRLPELHPSLKSLPNSFYNIMNGISVMVSMFLGASTCNDQIKSPHTFHRGERKSASIGASERAGLNDTRKASSLPRYFEKSSLAKLVRDDINLQSKQNKKVVECVVDTNSILHIFSAWLFETCLTGISLEQVLQTVGKISFGLPLSCLEVSKEEKEQYGNFLPVKKNDFEPGRAQTFCTLCHIFCCQKAVGQAILPVYLSRFYLSLAVGLCYAETRAGMVLGSILLSARDLFKLDLQGVQVLIPHVLQALEIVLPVPDSELVLGYDFSVVELRQSCIQILFSMICLPLHFMSLPIQALCQEKVNQSSEAGNCYLPQITFISLRSRVTNLLIKAIEVETNPLNTQMLLGGAKLLMEDAMQVELHNDNLKSSKPGSLPCIVLDEQDILSSSPSKLIDFATSTLSKTDPPRKNSILGGKNIGSLGDSNDMLTTKGFFCYMSTLLCQKLMFAGKWRGDLAVTLAALEFLSGMAQLNIKFVDDKVARKTLKWLCDYIEFQAKQPPPSHSKDLHSIIVAAFSCISVWVVSHSWLLDDKFFSCCIFFHQQCLGSVMEVIELGISGNKSKGRFAEVNNVLKGDKELKPVSFRVRESAEALLALIMEHAGFFPTPCGPESMFTLMDEKDFYTENDRKFTYYALDGSLIIGLLEDGVHGLSESLPSVMSIIRGPTGKRVCLMQLRHFARNKQYLADLYTTEPSTPYGLHNIPDAPPISQRCYPPGIDTVESTNADLSMPEIKDLLKEGNQMMEQENLRTLLSLQIEQENLAKLKFLEDSSGSISQKQPDSIEDCSTARLVLSHLGFLNLEHLQISTSRQVWGLQRLNNTEEKSLLPKLKKLDTYPCRTFDTMFVFYVKKGQNDPLSILSNKISSIESHFFMEFLQSLGWPVNMSTHAGWNGGFVANFNAAQPNKDKKMYYYADPLTELAIHVPALNADPFTIDAVENTIISQQLPIVEITPATGSENLLIEGKSSKRHTVLEQTGSVEMKHRAHHCHSETKVVIAWLQEFADEASFPALDLIELCDPHEKYSSGNINYSRVPEKEVVVIYVHPLKTGLYRIKINALFGSSVGGPLVSGMVVSRRVLGSMVRNTAINICRRRRLELDSCSPPHVCRKIKIQEIIREHAKEMNIPEFYTELLHDSSHL